jgi:hypothetical protein
MATTNQLNKGGISPALGLTAPTAHYTGNAAPHTTTTGTDTTPVVTEEYVCEIFVPLNCRSTGFAVLNGSAVAGNMQIALYNSSGNVIATTASTAASGTAALQSVPWTAPIDLVGPGEYYVGVQNNNTSNRLRTHTLGLFAASKKTGQTYGTFTALTVPTTFTTGQGPIGGLY